MLFDPCIQVKAVEGDPVFAYGDDGYPRTDIAIEDATADAAVGWRIAVTDHTRLQHCRHDELSGPQTGAPERSIARHERFEHVRDQALHVVLFTRGG